MSDECLGDVEPYSGAGSRLRVAVQICPERPDVLAEKSILDLSMVDALSTPGAVVDPGFSFIPYGSVKRPSLFKKGRVFAVRKSAHRSPEAFTTTLYFTLQ